MSRASLHSNAGAVHLGALRFWVFAMGFADVAKDPLSQLATLPFAAFHPVGVLRLVPSSVWSMIHTESGLRAWWALMLVLLALSALGVRGYRVIALVTCVLLTFYQGLIFSFADVTHAELASLYVMYIVACFPSADALSLDRSIRKAQSASVYRAAILMATIVLLSTYMLTGVRRLFAGGIDIFTDGTILSMVADGSITPDHLTQGFGLQLLESSAGRFTLEGGFVLVTVFEMLSLFCLGSTWFRRLWLAVMLPFHILSWPLLQTLFVHNILLILVLLVDVDGLVRRSGVFGMLKAIPREAA